jgi:hypothetical protein
VLGFAAAFWGIVMAISPALQIRRMLQHRSSREVSVAYFWVHDDRGRPPLSGRAGSSVKG